jgi:hypothetical protein
MWNDESKKGYVGLTEHTVEKRVQEHKDWKDDPIHKHPGEWYHKAVVACHYFSKSTLAKIERKYIEHYHFNGEYPLINTQKMPKEEKQVKTKIKCGSYDEELKKIFQIEEGKGFYRIRVRSKEIKVDVTKRYSDPQKKEIARQKIEEEQKKLILNFSL